MDLKEMIKSVMDAGLELIRKIRLLQNDMADLQGKKNAPRCIGCKYGSQESLFDGGQLHTYCTHWAMENRESKKRWVKATEKGQTSPVWCPLRMIRQMMQEEKRC